MDYPRLLAELNNNSDEKYRGFHRKLLNNPSLNVIGVRVPVLRKIAANFKGEEQVLLSFPNEIYEVKFIKLVAAAKLKYEEFIEVVDYCVGIIDNWAANDCFLPKCVKTHRDEFLPYIRKYLAVDKEFYQRFALTTLLSSYVEDNYLPVVLDCVSRADTRYYYVHMAAAWLVAEVLIKRFDDGVKFLNAGSLDAKTHNKAIQKARESFRLTQEQKQFLQGLKR